MYIVGFFGGGIANQVKDTWNFTYCFQINKIKMFQCLDKLISKTKMKFNDAINEFKNHEKNKYHFISVQRANDLFCGENHEFVNNRHIELI